MPREGKAVADPPRVQQQGIDQVAVGVCADVERLAAVEEKRDVQLLGLALPSELEKFCDEIFERPASSFLSDQIEACLGRLESF